MTSFRQPKAAGPSALRLISSRPGRMELRRRWTTRLWPAVTSVSRLYRASLGRRVRIVAVVGSVGKTTTVRVVSAALGRRVHRAALLNSSSYVATGRALFRTRPWHRHAVLEGAIGQPGEMEAIAAVMRPDVVVVTAIARDHWQSMPNLETTRHEKAFMLRALGPSGVAVVNADDDNVRWMATQTRARVILVGEATDADVRVSEVEFDWPHGMQFVLDIGGQKKSVRIKLVGRHMVFPAAAAITVAWVEGLPLDQAISAVGSVEPTPGRMQTTALSSGAFAIRDDFKGSEDAAIAALDAFAEIPAKRHFLVFGEIAEVRGREAYRDLAARAGAFVDRVIFVGSTTSYKLYRSGAVAAGMDRDRVSHVRSWPEALDSLRDELGEGDVVLIRGRWQQALGRVALKLAGRDVQCRADPCPFKRMLCDICPMLETPFTGLGVPVEAEV